MAYNNHYNTTGSSYNYGMGRSFGNYYNSADRIRQMEDGWRSSMDATQRSILKKWEQMSNERSESTASDNKGDVHQMQIEQFRKEIQNFRQDSEGFKGPCFTKLYRQLNSKCLKIQQELDELDVAGKDKIHKEKKQMIQECEQIWKEIFDKVHDVVCDDCEVQHV